MLDCIILFFLLWSGAVAQRVRGVSQTGLGCPRCVDVCGVNFNSSTANVDFNVHFEAIALLVTDCQLLQKYKTKYPNVRINEVDSREVLGAAYEQYTGSAESFLIRLMLERKDTAMDIVEINSAWTGGFGKNLLPLDDLDMSVLYKAALIPAPHGKLVGVPYYWNQELIYYRKDLLDKYGYSYPGESWQQFHDVFSTIAAKEREALGTDDFFGFMVPFDTNNAWRIAFQTVCVSAGFGDSTIVDINGKVKVNDPAIIDSLKMIKNWLGNFMPRRTLISCPRQGHEEMLAGRLAAIVDWTEKLSFFPVDTQPYEFTLGPIPGSGGSGGVYATWSLGVNKATKNPELAKEMMQDLVYATINTPRAHPTTAPVHQSLFENPALKEAWCNAHEINVMLCEAMEQYPRILEGPEFPGVGCGPLDAECVKIFYEAVMDFLNDRTTAEEAVATAETNLRTLLGNVAVSDSDSDGMTDERIALVVISPIVGVILVCLVYIVVSQMRLMPRTKGFKIPVSVMLGTIVLASVVTATMVINTKNLEAMKDISEDMAGRLSEQSLFAVKETVVGSLVTSMRFDDQLISAIKNTALAQARSALVNMDIDKRSLVIIVDRVDSFVVFSTDGERQPQETDVPHPLATSELASEWLVKGLELLKQPWQDSNVDEKKTFKLRVNGEEMYLNMQVAEASWNDRFVSWLVLYFIPEEVVLEKAIKATEKSTDVGIIVVLLAVVVTVAATVAITTPLVSLANDIKCVTLMQVEDVNLTRQSLLTELSALLCGFHRLTIMMFEYKAFMPKTVFADTTDDDEESAGSGSHQRSNLSDSRTSTAAHGEKGVQVALGMRTSMGTLVIIGIPNFYERIYESSDYLLERLSVIEGKVETFRGVIHPLGGVNSGEILVSWGFANSLASSRERASNFARTIGSALEKVSLAVHHGKCKNGNTGTKCTKVFALGGPCIKQATLMSRAARQYVNLEGRSFIMASEEAVINFSTRPVDVVCLRTKYTLLVEMLEAVQVAEEEWMYQLESQKPEGKSAFASCLTKIVETQTLREHLEAFANGTSNEYSDLEQRIAVSCRIMLSVAGLQSIGDDTLIQSVMQTSRLQTASSKLL